MKSRSSAGPLALTMVALVLYASLYPFVGWRGQGVEPWAFMTAPWPRYWTAFDVVSNVLGYLVLGFLLAVALFRARPGPMAGRWVLACLVPILLSFLIESLQSFLPMRVSSRLDLATNSLGAVLGAATAWALTASGGLKRWSQLRADWFVVGARGSLVLLALWPAALLYPASVPFGLGQFWSRWQAQLEAWFADQPWWPAWGLRWSLNSLAPLEVTLCVTLGVLAPLLMGLADVRSLARRLVFWFMLLLCAGATNGLSAALTYGPEHSWAWWSDPVEQGLGLAALAGLGALFLPRRVCHALMVVCLVVSMVLLNGAPPSPYFAQSLELWEQGRFIRFHGLSQWLGWLWPVAALLFGARALLDRRQLRWHGGVEPRR